MVQYYIILWLMYMCEHADIKAVHVAAITALTSIIKQKY